MESDRFYLEQAYSAGGYSPDPRTQVGAILINDLSSCVVRACNTFPIGVEYKDERLERPTKYLFIEHAERNAILAAARWGIRTQDMVMYVTWFACADCARAIIQAGIKELVVHDVPRYHSVPEWQESIDAGYAMLNESGVKHRYVTDIIGRSIKFNGEIIDV